MSYNYHEEHLHFLKEKIKNIKIALFKSDINSELQLPNNVIQVIQIGDDGNIWFFTSCRAKQAENIEKSFYAYLDFHKKGTDFNLLISGKANIVEDGKPLLPGSNSDEMLNKLVLIKMKIMQAEYFESRHSTNSSLGDKIRTAINHFFLFPRHKVFDFS